MKMRSVWLALAVLLLRDSFDSIVESFAARHSNFAVASLASQSCLSDSQNVLCAVL